MINHIAVFGRKKKMKIKIANEQDRITVAGILVKNGYTIRIVKQKQPGRSQNDYFVEIVEDEKK